MGHTTLQLFKYLGRSLADAKLTEEQAILFLESYAAQAYVDKNTKDWCKRNILDFYRAAAKELEIIHG